MNIAGFSGFPRPLANSKRTDQAAPAEENVATRRTTNSAEFTAFLNMLVGTDAKLRTDLLKQLPAEGAGLLDHLLAGAADGTLDETTLALASESVPETATSDAVRYSMLANRVPPLELTGTAGPMDRSGIITPTDKRGIIAATAKSGILTPTDEIGIGTSRVHTPTGQSRISPAVLARIAARKTPSVEELLAVGDREGALARAKLDDLLTKAGTVEGLSLSEMNAMNAALASALAASAADVGTPVRNMEALDPELRTRFERVAERMKNEFGHDVKVVETARSQERQDHLYAQGRSTTGSVVTWTTHSAHSHGEALDVVVDGTWDNPTGFARLQQIAKEEGLGTLGARDPGHLELPKEEWTNGWTNNADVRVTGSFTSSGNSGIARVATVARVATIASAGNAGRAATIPQPVQQNTPINASLGLMAQAANTGGSTSSSNSSAEQDTSRDRRNQSARSTVTPSEAATEKSSSRATVTDRDKSGTQNASPMFGGSTGSTTSFIGPVDELERPAGVTAAEAAERVEGINTMRQQQGSKPLSQLTLEMDGPDGSTQQITVDVRGNTVGTHISADSQSADRMRSHVNELKTGLENRGLESDSVRISSQGARAADAADQVKAGATSDREALRMSGAGASGSSGGNDGATQQQRDRSSAARDWEDRQATRDEQRAQRDGQQPQRRGSNSQDATRQDAQRPQYQEKR
ncbi:MAG: hypothetical protein H7Z40_16785 [Phycisphaerae bacterium]|nr:hypothetical protein [Gemmatimonadaceae bacterium]